MFIKDQFIVQYLTHSNTKNEIQYKYCSLFSLTSKFKHQMKANCKYVWYAIAVGRIKRFLTNWNGYIDP